MFDKNIQCSGCGYYDSKYSFDEYELQDRNGYIIRLYACPKCGAVRAVNCGNEKFRIEDEEVIE